MQLGELVTRVNGAYRTARYILERGHADPWVRRTAGSGHYRDLEAGEAFALVLLLKLNQSGVAIPKAKRVVVLVFQMLRGVAIGLGWEHYFAPFFGYFDSQHRWIIELGDLIGLRILTDSNPSRGGKLEPVERRWLLIEGRRRDLVNFKPCFVLRIHLTRLAGLLKSGFPVPDRKDFAATVRRKMISMGPL